MSTKDLLHKGPSYETLILVLAELQAKDFWFSKRTPQMKLRCAIYARVSTDDKGQDPLNQLLQLREFAGRQDWEVVKEYIDEASAKNGERKGFKALFADAARHRFDVLLFWSLDRLTREGTFKTHCYLKQLTDAGIKFKSFTEQYVDSLGVFGDAIIGLLAAMAQQERIRISDRTKAGIARLRAAGKKWKRGANRTYKAGKPSRTTLWRRAQRISTAS
jgi:DNA invertase Pin-like site-specific DNA recombinase